MVTHSTQTQAVATIVTQQMEQHDISVKSLSETTLIPRTTLIRRLSGESAFRLNELEAIAKQLGQTASELMAAADELLVA